MSNGVQDDDQGEQTPAGGLAVGDILFTLFRHKLLIISSIVLGLAAVVAVRFIRPPKYESTAQIYVPYVVELRVVSTDPNTPITPTAAGGDVVMNTEMDIMKSFNTTVEVAKEIGYEKILAKYGGGSDPLSAAGVIASGITVSPPAKSMSLVVTFSHRDPDLVQPIMAEILKVYMRRHLEIHFGVDGVFVKRREDERIKLEGIEKELTTLKTSSGVANLRERMSAVAKEISDLQSQGLKARSELAGRKAELGDLGNMTNLQANAVPPEIISGYSEIMAHIEEIKKRQRALRLDGLTTINPSVARLGIQMQDLAREKSSLEIQFPVLKNYISAVQRSGVGGVTNGTSLDLESELIGITMLEKKIKSNDEVLAGLTQETFDLMAIEPKLTELERRRDVAKGDYERVTTLVDKAKSDANSTGGAVQMSMLQDPTPPKLNKAKFLKLVGIAFGGCVGLGLGLAFLMDMVLDRSIRRPSQIIRSLRLPVVLTIPDANREESGLFFSRRRNGNMKVMRRDKSDDSDKMANAVAPWSPDNQLQIHIEGLRERVITHFEVKDLEHSPKLVAVTACMNGAGVTTLASGLAAALSRTGNGSALLVDMNAGEGVTHSFYKGKPGYGPSESIEADFDDEDCKKNMSLEKVSGGGSRRSRLSGILPPSFNEHSPKLKADAYDYVVFDMTAISPASVTPRLSGHMDLVLFVIESEKTKDHTARDASALMRESRANVMAILNKYHNPVPGWLSHD